VDGTDPGLCPVAGFGINCIDPTGSVTIWSGLVWFGGISFQSVENIARTWK
jgi:hypothetical protein